MATGPEMMMENALKMLARVFKLDPEKVQAQVTEIHSTIVGVGRMGAVILSLLLMANRRLARIEAFHGLNDIEPVPEAMKVIDHVEINADAVLGGNVPVHVAGGR